MEQNKNDRGNSSDQRKKLSYAKEHMKGRKYTVVRPEHRTNTRRMKIMRLILYLERLQADIMTQCAVLKVHQKPPMRRFMMCPITKRQGRCRRHVSYSNSLKANRKHRFM